MTAARPGGRPEPSPEKGLSTSPVPSPGLSPAAGSAGAPETTPPKAPATHEPAESPAEPAEPAAAAQPGPADAGQRTSPWGVLARMGRPRLTRATLAATALTGLLGFALATQVQSTSRQGLETLRTPDLVRILGDQNARAARLDSDVRQLERTRDQLQNGANDTEAVARAQSELDALGVLTGTKAATGPGITMTITDRSRVLTYTHLLDLVQELRDAGAEAIQIGDARVVAATAFSQKDGVVTVGGTTVDAPYEVRAIGDAATLQSAMKIPGGIVETFAAQGASVTITTSTQRRADVVVDALAQPRTPRYAHPVPAPSPSAS